MKILKDMLLNSVKSLAINNLGGEVISRRLIQINAFRIIEQNIKH